MFIIIMRIELLYFDQVGIGRRDYFFSCPLCFLLFPHECLGKHSCMSSPLPIAILNGTFFFHEAKQSLLWQKLRLSETNQTIYQCRVITHFSLPISGNLSFLITNIGKSLISQYQYREISHFSLPILGNLSFLITNIGKF